MVSDDRAQLAWLEGDHAKALSELRRLNEALNRANAELSALTQKEKDLKATIQAERANFADAKTKLRDSISVTRERLKDTSELWRTASRYYSLFWQGLLADEISKSEVSLAADTYLCLLPSTVPAALDLKRKYGGRIICDCVENVEVERQSLAPNLHPVTLDMINMEAYGALSVVDGLMTVSDSVADTLHRFGPPIRVQPNFRRFEVPRKPGGLRERFNLPQNAKVVVASGGIVGGFEEIVEAFSRLPSDVYLIAFAKFSPLAYDEEIRSLIERAGLSSRIILNEFVPYSELSLLLADADVGLIVLDPQNPNHSVSLPNRVFDCTTSALPFVSPDVPEVVKYVQKFGFGISISDVSAESWRTAIVSILQNRDEFSTAMSIAREQLTWEALEEGLVDFLGNPGSVTLLGFRDLSRYQRFLRVTDTLTRRGIEVKAAFFSKSPLPIENTSAEFYYFSDRYGRGPGLLPLSSVGLG